MKLAFSSNGGTTVSGHMGRAKGFVIVDVSENGIDSQTFVENKMDHGEHHHHHGHDNHDHGHHHSHAPIIDALRGVDAVFSKHIGPHLISELDQNKIKAYLIREEEISRAVAMFMSNQLEMETVSDCSHD
jgi:predicted Fe-Mo cluster-binding NifX family protein